jgi:hypothetical protein
MIKKTVLATTLLATLANAEIDQTGFFVGIDGSKRAANITYNNNETAFAIRKYTSKSTQKTLSYKLGYQYYFTRLYARVNSFKDTDGARNKYTIQGRTYEIDAEYIPIFYMSKSKNWDIRGLFGLGMGYNSSKLENHDVNLLPVDVGAGSAQNFLQYGYQVGILAESEIGLSVELGLRFRQGHLLEYSDGQNEATFTREETAYYFGVNYLF